MQDVYTCSLLAVAQAMMLQDMYTCALLAVGQALRLYDICTCLTHAVAQAINCKICTHVHYLHWRRPQDCTKCTRVHYLQQGIPNTTWPVHVFITSSWAGQDTDCWMISSTDLRIRVFTRTFAHLCRVKGPHVPLCVD
jgi:hypothetical protein